MAASSTLGVAATHRMFVRVAFIIAAGVLTSRTCVGADSVAAASHTLKHTTTFTGMCDASGAVAIDAVRFVVANDEDNILRVYHRDRASPLTECDLEAHLKVDPAEPESDIEGCCRIGERIYWITSHGRNKKGLVRESRGRLFATKIEGEGDNARVVGVGNVYQRLLADLLSDERLTKYNLVEASEKAPKKKGGLNIEGLAATPEGRLLVAFRNPIPNDKALVVPIENPKAIIDDGAKAKLGAPIELDLSFGGNALAVRSIDYDPERKLYWIVGGSFESGGKFMLFQWSGKASDRPKPMRDVSLEDLNPEAIFIYPGRGGAIQLLSDDGTRLVGKKECKKLNDPERRTFRSAMLIESGN